MTPSVDQIHRELPSLIADRFNLRQEINELRAENERLRKVIKLMQNPDIAKHARRADAAAGDEDRELPPFDWRYVIFNPQFGWPDDVVADAKRLRAAEFERGASQGA